MTEAHDESMEMAHMSLVMPFVVCQTQGGPYDDDAFVAGFECGRIDDWLESAIRPDEPRVVHAGSVPQLDLIAMKYGYAIEATDEVDGWVTVRFQRSK